MPDARTIIDGTPGEIWTNDTDRPWYQLVASLINTCGLCLQYHLKIARYWALGLHPGCRCYVVVVKMGQTAPHPFCDYEKLALSFDPHDQAKLFGKSNFKLWRAGLVDWSDIVTPSRIRSLEQVVARQRLSIKQMIKAGVDPVVARQAHAAVHTPEHQQVAAHRKELLQKIAGAGVNHDLVVKHIGEKLASRAVIAAGPTYTTKAGEVIPGVPAGRLIDPSALRQQHAAELKDLLSTAVGVQKVVAAMGGQRKLPEASRRLVESEIGASAARNAAAFVEEIAAGLAAGKIYSGAIMALYRRYASR